MGPFNFKKRNISWIKRNLRSSFILFAYLTSASICFSQELIPNGDFEEFTSCPTGQGQLDSLLHWFKPTGGTTDFYHACSPLSNFQVPNNILGYQPALSGDGYAGAILYSSNTFNYREYMECKLNEPMVVGTPYYISINVNVPNYSKLATENIEVYFSDTLITGVFGSSVLPYEPQLINSLGLITDTVNWVELSWIYTANGGEEYMIIGNFNDDANSTTDFINPFVSGATQAYLFFDNISLSVFTGSESIETDLFSTYPNPVENDLFIRSKNNVPYTIFIYDILGTRQYEARLTVNDRHDLSDLKPGVYLVHLKSESGITYWNKIIKRN